MSKYKKSFKCRKSIFYLTFNKFIIFKQYIRLLLYMSQPEICDIVFVVFSRNGVRTSIIIKILIEAETPYYTV